MHNTLTGNPSAGKPLDLDPRAPTQNIRPSPNGVHRKPPPSPETIAHQFDLILAPDQTVEVRSFATTGRGARSRLFGPDDRLAMARHALELAAADREVYWTLNPIRHGAVKPDRAANDAAIDRRRLLLVDTDPFRPDAAIEAHGVGGKVSASDEEKAHALQLAEDMRAYLTTKLGWPSPVFADSGNGYHQYYSVDLPNDEAARDLVKAVLDTLAYRFDTADAHVDTVVYNASRITKFYGTTARKGEPTADRPHRLSAILEVPDGFGARVVSREQLERVAAMRPAPEPPHAPSGPPVSVAGGRPDDGRWTPEMRATAYLLKCEPAIEGQEGSKKAFKAAINIGPGFDLDPDTALRLLRDVYNPTCEPQWSEKELRHKVEDAYAKCKKPRGWLLNAPRDRGGCPARMTPPAAKGEPTGRPPDGDGGIPAPPSDPGQPEPTDDRDRVLVEINTQWYVAVEQSIEALAARDGDIYRRGEDLVTVIQEDNAVLRLTVKTTLESVGKSLRIIALSEHPIGERLTRHVEFFSWTKDRNGEFVTVSVRPPDWLLKVIARRKHWPGIKYLAAVAECPFPRPDGSIVEAPGYDPATCVLFMPSMAFPPIPDNPSREDARACWGRIKHHFRYFPFASEDDEVVVLAGMLNVIARHAVVGPMPGVSVNGNRAGTGKGFCVDGMVMPGIGRPAPVTKYPTDREEAAKVKTSLISSSKSVVSFDNVEEGTNYGGPDIDSLLTALTIDDRSMGSGKMTGEMVVRLATFVNGNNISPVKDAFRRWMVCNLVTELEHPERREDIREEIDGRPAGFRELILHKRGEIVRDALTILRAHALAGRPNDGWAPLGTFEEWDHVVRGAVWFATDRDCVATQHKAAEESQDNRDKVAFLEGWRELPGGRFEDGRGETVAHALELLERHKDRFETLRQLLLRKGRAGQFPDNKAIGKMLSAMKNSTHGGLKLVKDDNPRHGAAVWSVKSSSPAGVNGHANLEPESTASPDDQGIDWTESNGVWESSAY